MEIINFYSIRLFSYSSAWYKSWFLQQMFTNYNSAYFLQLCHYTKYKIKSHKGRYFYYNERLVDSFDFPSQLFAYRIFTSLTIYSWWSIKVGLNHTLHISVVWDRKDYNPKYENCMPEQGFYATLRQDAKHVELFWFVTEKLYLTAASTRDYGSMRKSSALIFE